MRLGGRCWTMAVMTAGLFGCVGTAASAAGDLPARAFGARAIIQQISMSPDGTHVAMIVPQGARGSTLQIADLVAGGAPQPILSTPGGDEQMTDCHWSTQTRLICRIVIFTSSGGDKLGFTRTMSVDSDGKRLKLMSARTNDRSLSIMQDGGRIIDWTADSASGAALMTRMFVPERTIGTLLASSAQGLGVERIDTTTLERHAVESGKPGATDYISDGHGVVRVMGVRPQRTAAGYDADYVLYSYRKSDSRTWLPMGRVTFGAGGQTGFDPYAVDRGLNVVYGFDDKDGRNALYKLALDGSMKRDLVLARPDVDVDQLIQIGRHDRVVGASYATEKRETEFFDPELRMVAASLRKALPGQPLISFVDASEDESKLLLFAGSDVDPGRYYVFDKATRQLAEILPVRPQLAGMTLAPVKPITLRATDGSMIPAYLTVPAGREAKGLPAIVMPHGGPSARDEWGFDWLAQYFAARGFAVLQPNFRGSAGYGSAWFQKNGFQSWRTAIGDIEDAGRWLVAQGIATPTRLAIVGWSYGGYAALQSAVVDPDLFKAVVAIAPVTDLETLRGESINYTNYANVDAFIGHGPHVREGSPARNAERIKSPVLLFHGDQDRNVDIGESRLMASKLKGAGKKVELVEFKGLDHQLDDSTARAAMLEKADTFLRSSLGL